MKKLVAIFMSAIMLASLAACGGGGGGQGVGVVPHEIFTTDEPLTGEITVSAFETIMSRDFLLEAAAMFEEKHPGTTINIETFSAMPEMRTMETEDGGMVSVTMVEDDPQARTDYINRISAQLMSGAGPDILAMDVLPIHRLARAGFLEDLSAYMHADPHFDLGEFRTNIFEAASFDGGMWFVPLDYRFTFYTFDSTLIPAGQAAGFGPDRAFTTRQLLETGSSLHDGSAMLFNTPDFTPGMRGMWGSIFAMLLNESFSDFVDLERRTANFDDGRFAALLTSIQEYAERGYIQQGLSGGMDFERIMSDFDRQPTERTFFKTKNSGMLAMEFLRDADNEMRTWGGGLHMIEDDDQIAGMAADANGNVAFTFTHGYAINSNSQNKRLAWEFIKFLLSHELQTSPNAMMRMGRPVRLSAVHPQAETFFGWMTGEMTMIFGDPRGQAAPALSDEMREVLYAYIKTADIMSDQINTMNMRDVIITDIIAAEAALFFDGTKSADQVAASLQSRLQLILSE